MEIEINKANIIAAWRDARTMNYADWYELYFVAEPKTDEDMRPCLHPIGSTTCGYSQNQPMHHGTTSALVPQNGRHDYKPADGGEE